MIKKFFAIIIVSIMLFALTGFVFAQSRELEIKYPEVAGEQPEQVTTPVTEYFKYIFNFLIWISGLIALVVLVYAGFQYFTSAGNPEAMNDAKSRIGAALLGILILFGSYLILITINPDLIVFHLPRLRPIISTLPPGVLLCTEEVDVMRAWNLTEEFKGSSNIDRQKEIKEELDLILKDISEKCATVPGKGNIEGTFQFVYFIPILRVIRERELNGMRVVGYEATEYGAILYEDKGYEGKSEPLYHHLIPGRAIGPIKAEISSLKASSIKPFVLIPEHHEEKFQVVLYQKPNQNQGTDFVARVYRLDPGNWYWIFDLTATPNFIYDGEFRSPESIKVGGDFIAILVTEDGRNDAFYNEIDHNLLDNYNIVNWVKCKEWASAGFGGGWRTTTCAEAAATELIIISAKVY